MRLRSRSLRDFRADPTATPKGAGAGCPRHYATGSCCSAPATAQRAPLDLSRVSNASRCNSLFHESRSVTKADAAKAFVDPEFRELFLDTVLRETSTQVVKPHVIQWLILVEAGKDNVFLSGHWIAMRLKALGTDLLHHALHR